jgi:Uma2 family endonuclease
MIGTSTAVEAIRPRVWPSVGGRRVPGVSPLEPGDRLTRYEFERRYEAMPRVKKAELIEGVVYMPSPIRHTSHSRPHAQIIGWLLAYCAATPGVDLGDNASVRLDLENELQPDALLRLDPAAGGASRISADDYIEGPPELIVEIAASSASYDLHDKLRVYRRNGVQEYLVWQVNDRRVDWFYLCEGQYVPLTADSEGVVRSRVFPGLQLAVPALLEGDLATVLAVLQQGCQGAEHAAFVERLAAMGEGQGGPH